MQQKYLLAILIICLLRFDIVYVFVVDFERLSDYLDQEQSVLEAFNEYLLIEEQRISRLRQIHHKFSEENSIALQDKDLFLSHPNDVYHLIKRIKIEWKTVEELKNQNKKNTRAILQLNRTKFNLNGR